MPSTYKTPFLGLNRFIGSDKPKMDDFNRDTQKLDDKLKEHFESQDVHWTKAEKDRWKKPYLIGTYTGNGQMERTVAIGFRPAFGIIFKVDDVPALLQPSGGQTQQYSAFITPKGCTWGCEARENGFYIMHAPNTTPDGRKAQLNSSGETYCYIMFY